MYTSVSVKGKDFVLTVSFDVDFDSFFFSLQKIILQIKTKVQA